MEWNGMECGFAMAVFRFWIGSELAVSRTKPI